MTAHPPGTCFPECPDYGLCHCGCGATTNIAAQSSKPQGYVRGRPYQRIHAHIHVGRVRPTSHPLGDGPERWRRRAPPSLRAAIASGRPSDAERELIASWVWVRVEDLAIDSPEAMVEAYREHRKTCTAPCPWAQDRAPI